MHQQSKRNEDDFWQAASSLSLPAGRFSPGLVRIDVTTTRPAVAELLLTFDRGSPPRLTQPFEMLAPTRYSLMLLLDAQCATASLRFTPPVEQDAITGVTVRKLGYLSQAILGLQKTYWNLARPRAFLVKLRQILSGSENFRISLPRSAGLDAKEAYAIWQRIYESERQHRRLRTALKRACSGRDRPRVLVIFATASHAEASLDAFLESCETEPTRTGERSCDLHLLVIENAGTSLTGRRSEMIGKLGGEILTVRDDKIPLQQVAKSVRRHGAAAFAFLEHPGVFSSPAFEAFALEFLNRPDALAVYADSDRIDGGGRRSHPFFKPGWSPEYLLSSNYIGGAIMFSPAVLDVEGVPARLPPGAASFSLMLEIAARERHAAIRRIPRILFHDFVTPRDDRERDILAEAEREALALWLARNPGPATLHPARDDGHRIRALDYRLPAPPPKISVVILSKDHPELLRNAVASVLDTDYPDLELIVIDNGSTTPHQRRLLAELKDRDGVIVLEYPHPFNFSAMNNVGRRSGRGDILLFLNDDTLARDTGWISEMAGLAIRPDIGCVGALLLYGDGSVQHAGVTLGVGGVAGHAFRHFRPGEPGTDSRLRVRREVSAVTAACLAVRASVFDEVGGFNEDLPIAFNDIDFCLKVREKGYRNLFTPNAVLTHYESTTRGLDVTPDQMQRLRGEIDLFVGTWDSALLDDPYYSPHLTRASDDYRLRIA